MPLAGRDGLKTRRAFSPARKEHDDTSPTARPAC